MGTCSNLTIQFIRLGIYKSVTFKVQILCWLFSTNDEHEKVVSVRAVSSAAPLSCGHDWNNNKNKNCKIDYPLRCWRGCNGRHRVLAWKSVADKVSDLVSKSAVNYPFISPWITFSTTVIASLLLGLQVKLPESRCLAAGMIKEAIWNRNFTLVTPAHVQHHHWG